MDTKVQSAVQALLLCKKKMKNEDLLDHEDMKVFLQISAFKVNPGGIKQTIKLPMPAPFRRSAEVCLFVKDLKRGIRVDHEKSLHHWKDFLEDRGITRVTEVMPLRQLKAEYSVFEAKRKLCDAYDIFLTDVRIARLLPTLLGKHFVAKKKQPISVKVTAADLAKEIDDALDASYLHLYGSGDSSSVQVGTCAQSASELSSNVAAAVGALAERFPGGARNVRTLHLKLARSPAVPIFVSDVLPGEVPVPAAPHRAGSRRGDVTGELSTLRAESDVTVTRHGDVIVTQKRPLSDDEDPSDQEHQTKDRKRGKHFTKTKKDKRTSKAGGRSNTEENVEEARDADEKEADTEQELSSDSKLDNSSAVKYGSPFDEDDGEDSSDEEDRVLEAQERRFLQNMEAEQKTEALAKAEKVAKAVNKKGPKSPTKEEKNQKNVKLAKKGKAAAGGAAKPMKQKKKKDNVTKPTIVKAQNMLNKQKDSRAATKKNYAKKKVKPVTKAKKVK